MRVKRIELILILGVVILPLAMELRVVLALNYTDGSGGTVPATGNDSRACNCTPTTTNCTHYTTACSAPDNNPNADYTCGTDTRAQGVQLALGRSIGMLEPTMQGGVTNMPYWNPLQCAWLSLYSSATCEGFPDNTFMCYVLIVVNGTEGCVP